MCVLTAHSVRYIAVRRDLFRVLSSYTSCSDRNAIACGLKIPSMFHSVILGGSSQNIFYFCLPCWNKNRVWIDVLLRSCKEMSQESFGYSIQCYCSLRALRPAYNVHLQKILCISEVSVRLNHGKTSCSLVLSTSSGVLGGLRTIWMTGFKTIRSGKGLWDLHYSISAKENRLWCGNSTIQHQKKVVCISNPGANSRTEPWECEKNSTTWTVMDDVVVSRKKWSSGFSQLCGCSGSEAYDTLWYSMSVHDTIDLL